MSDSSNTLFVGDGIAALKRLSDTSVDCLYADPPFGTGRHFTSYTDITRTEFDDLVRSLLAESERVLKPGAPLWLHLGEESSDWARPLIAASGARLNATVAWERTYAPKAAAAGISGVLDTIFVLSFGTDFVANRLPFVDDSLSQHRSWDGDPRAWISGDLSGPRADECPHLVFGVTNPFTGKVCYPRSGRHWTITAEAMLEQVSAWAPGAYLCDLGDDAERAAIAGCPRAGVQGIAWRDNDRARQAALARLAQPNWPSVIFGRTGSGGPRRKRYQDAAGRVASTLWTHREVGSIQSAKTALSELLPHQVSFSTPKPEPLLRRIIEMSTAPGDFVVDPFAGSGTTAAVAHKLSRRWMSAELDQATVDTYIRPRLDLVSAGRDPLVDTRLAAGLPFRVKTGEPTRAAEVITSFLADGRLADLDEATLRRLRFVLRRADEVVSTPVVAQPHDYAVEQV